MRLVLCLMSLSLNVTIYAQTKELTIDAVYDRRTPVGQMLVRDIAEINKLSSEDSAFNSPITPTQKDGYHFKKVPIALVIFQNDTENLKGRGPVDLLLLNSPTPKGGLKTDPDLSRVFGTGVIRVRGIELSKLATKDSSPNANLIFSTLVGGDLHPNVLKSYQKDLLTDTYLAANHPIRQTLGSVNALLISPYPGPATIPGIKDPLTESLTEAVLVMSFDTFMENSYIKTGVEYYEDSTPEGLAAMKKLKEADHVKNLLMGYSHLVFQISTSLLDDPKAAVADDLKLLKGLIDSIRKECPSLAKILFHSEHEQGAGGFVAMHTLHTIKGSSLPEAVEAQVSGDVSLPIRTGALGYLISRLRHKSIPATGEASEKDIGIWETIIKQEKVTAAPADKLEQFLQDLPIVMTIDSDAEMERMDEAHGEIKETDE